MLKKGFTLIELLVVIAIIAMLLAILMPALGSVKERAKRVVCGNQLKQMGIGIATYATDQGDKLPDPYFRGVFPWQSFFAYQINPNATDENDKITSSPYNLGYLFDADIINNPKVFYCPSALKNDDEFGIYWRYEDYVGNLSWPFTSDPDRYHANNVRVSYSYVPQSKTRMEQVDGTYVHEITTRMSKLDNRAVMLTDVLSTLDSLPHKAGRKKPSGVNALFGDSSVSFCNNKDAFEGRLWETPPNNDAVNFRTILTLLAGN